MQSQTVKSMVNAAKHCPTRARQRLLLGIACALELGDEGRAKKLYEAALELGLFQANVVPRGTRVALAGVWLIKTLSLHPMPVKTVLERGWNCGFNAATMRRAARGLLVVRSKRVGCGVPVWTLPASKAFWRSLMVRFARMQDRARKSKALGWPAMPHSAMPKALGVVQRIRRQLAQERRRRQAARVA